MSLHPALLLNSSHDCHHLFGKLDLAYQVRFAMCPDGSLPSSLSVDLSLLRKLKREIAYPYSNRWNRPRDHLRKHFTGSSRNNIIALFNSIVEDIYDLLDIMNISIGISASLMKQKRIIDDLLVDTRTHPEIVYYSIPFAISLLLELATIAKPLGGPDNDLPNEILDVTKGFFVYPNDDESSFEFFCTYNGYISGGIGWHLISSIRMGRSVLGYKISAPWRHRHALSLTQFPFVTAYDRRDLQLNPSVGYVCQVTFV